MERDCKHGQLARSCQLCEMEERIEDLKEGIRDIFVIAFFAHYAPETKKIEAITEILNICIDAEIEIKQVVKMVKHNL